MNKVIVGAFSSALLLSTAAYAAAPSLVGSPASQDRSGVYVGIQLGYDNLNYDKSWVKKYVTLSDGTQPSSVGSITDSGPAARLYLGYDFNKYFGVEAGAAGFQKVKLNKITFAGYSDSADEKFNESLMDLFVKGTYPFGNGFSVYGKAGAGFVHRDDVSVTINGVKYKSNGSDDKTVPALGVGASYNFTRQFFADVAYTRYFENGDLPAIDLVVAGVGYQFC